MPSPTPLAITRILRPKRRADLLRRPRLLDFLHEHIERKLIIVPSPAGFGKTSLLIDFAEDTDLPICWYTLSEADRDLHVFAESLIASIRQRFPSFGQHSQTFLAGAQGSALDPASLASLLVNDIYTDIPDYFVIVLDDFHQLADDERINYLIDSMLHDLPDNCHLIVASRSIPRLTPKGMALLVARREVAGLGVKDLRFDAAEIQALLAQNFNQHIPQDQAEALARESEGWITGILLTTHNMWKGLFSSIVRAKGAGSQLYEYLANEVFNQQPPEIQSFLRATAILDEMTPALCNRLLGRRDGRQALQMLEERNLFISSIERGNELWYRYHNLFQQFLQTKADEAGELAALHARAGAILEEDGAWPEAIGHYSAVGRHHDAARIVSLAARAAFEQNHWQTLSGWIDALPADILLENPRLLWYRGDIHSALGELERSLAVYQRAHTGFEQAGDGLGVADVLIRRAVPLRRSGRLQTALEDARRALSILEQAERTPGVVKSCAEAHRVIGTILAQTGSLRQGSEELRTALALYEELNDQFGMANLHSDLGTSLRMAGNLAGSDVHFEQAVELWQELGSQSSLANTLNNVGLGHHLRGDYGKALNVYERTLAIAEEAALWWVKAVVLAGMGDVYRDLGQYEQAFAAYTEARPLAERSQEAWLVSYLLDALGNTYILTGDYVRANELIRQAYEQAKERTSRQAAAVFLTSLGVLSYERGDPKQAIEQLLEAQAVLQEIGARRDLPKVHLHLAQAYYLNGQWDECLAALDEVGRDVFNLGYDHFLEPIVRRMAPMLSFARRRRPQDDLLASLAQRLDALHPLSPAPSTPGAVTAASPKLKIYGLGETRAVRDDVAIDQREWGTAKAKELLFYLLSYPHRRKEQIGMAFWPELSPAKLRSAFHVTVFRLRRGLGVPDCVLFEDDRYSFNQRLDYWYDVQEFERLVARAEHAQATDPHEYEFNLKQAVALYRGDFLEDLPSASEEAWYHPLSEGLRKKWLQSVFALGTMAIESENYETALDYFWRIARRDSFQEAAHRAIMEVYARMGNRNAALRHYRDLESTLQDELGVSPTAETAQLYRRILQGGGARTD